MEPVNLQSSTLEGSSSTYKIKGFVFDGHELEEYSRWIQSAYASLNPINLSKLPRDVTKIEFDDCRGLKGRSLSKIPNQVTDLTFRSITVNSTVSVWEKFTHYADSLKEGYSITCVMWSPKISHLSALRVVVFEKCELDEIDWLPNQVERLDLTECRLRSRMVGIKVCVFSLKKLGAIKDVTLDKCQNVFNVEFSKDNNRIKYLKIFDHSPRLRDDNFSNFPDSLRVFQINGADITDTTIEKIESGIVCLSLKDCPKVTMNSGRAKFVFPNCTWHEGFKEEVSITDKIRKLLEQAVIGQSQAIDVAFDALCIALSATTSGKKPAGVLFFVGPSGVGKTELAKAVASAGDRKLLRYDMAEYQKEHEVSKLIGAPPGYIGYQEGGKLINDVEKYPNAVVLFDEIEKAHIAVHKTLLGVFDEGRLTDGKGKTISFSKTIIIMTSNLGAQAIANLDWSDSASALKDSENIVKALLKETVSFEFTGRIKTTVPFRPLNKETMKNIVESKVRNYEQDIKRERKIQLEISENVWLLQLSDPDLSLGARPIINKVEEEIGAALAHALLNKIVREGDRVRVVRESGKIEFKSGRT